MSPIMDNTFAIDFFSGCVPVWMCAWAKLESVPPPESEKPCIGLFAPNLIARLCQEELFFWGELLCVERSNELALSRIIYGHSAADESKVLAFTLICRIQGCSLAANSISPRDWKTTTGPTQESTETKDCKVFKVLTKSHKGNTEKCFFCKTGADWRHFCAKTVEINQCHNRS